MKKNMNRIVSLFLAMITTLGLISLPASAAAPVYTSDSAYTVDVDTSGGKFYIVNTSNAKLKTKATFYGSTYATYTKGSLIKINGSSGDYYKVYMGNTNYYIKKSDVRAASSTFSATIDYTTKTGSNFRTGPAEKCSSAYKQAIGTAFLTCGSLVNSSNNRWSVVYDPNTRNLTYLYSGNCANVCTNAQLTLSAHTDTVGIKGTLQLNAEYRPSVLTNSITWTSSNPGVASVTSNGLVTGLSAGTATITATVNGLNGYVSTSTNIYVSPAITLNVPVMRQFDSAWKYKYIANSSATIGSYGCLLTSAAMCHSYDIGRTVYPTEMDDLLKFTSGGALYWNSLEKYGYYKHNYNTKVNNNVLSAIYSQLKNGQPVIVGGRTSSNVYHYIVVTGYTGWSDSSFSAWDFTINDPGNANRHTLQDYLNTFSTITALIY